MSQIEHGNLQVIYDFQMNPASYDFIAFLGVAEKYRIDQAYTHMDVHFVPAEGGRFFERYHPKDEGAREALFWRVCVPACRLVSSVQGVTVHGKRSGIGGKTFPETWAPSRPDNTHGGNLFKSAAQCFNASGRARAWVDARYSNYMTITLRQCDYGIERNSDLQAWHDVARRIRDEGLKVVIVPDTNAKGFDGFENCELAAWDLDIRLALYEGALLNMGVANGPMTLGILSRSKMLMCDTDLDIFNQTENVFNSRTAVSDLMPFVHRRLREARAAA